MWLGDGDTKGVEVVDSEVRLLSVLLHHTFRRVVASPQPVEIVEFEVIRYLLEMGALRIKSVTNHMIQLESYPSAHEGIRK